MSESSEFVDAFIGATLISLDAGFPRTARRILETHWLEAAANEQQRNRFAELRNRTFDGLRIEALYGQGALINLDHEFSKNQQKEGRITPDHLIAIQKFRNTQLTE